MPRLPVGRASFARYGLMDGLPDSIGFSEQESSVFPLAYRKLCVHLNILILYELTCSKRSFAWGSIVAIAMGPEDLELVLRRLAFMGAPKETLK